MLFLVERQKELSKVHMDLTKKEDYFGIGDFPKYQRDFSPMVELNTMKVSMY